MRMGVWEIMEIDKSLQATAAERRASFAKPQKKLIDPEVNRSLPKNDFITDSDNSKIVITDPSTQPCRDCPEGMQW